MMTVEPSLTVPVQAGHVAKHGHGFQEGFVGRAGKGPVGGIGVLVGAAGGQHDVVSREDGLET